MGDEIEVCDTRAGVLFTYGCKASTEPALRLETELAPRGLDVWLDVSQIRAGRA